MKYKIKDKVKIIRCIDNPYYLNMTGKIVGKVDGLSLVKLGYDGKILIMIDEQLIKIEKD